MSDFIQRNMLFASFVALRLTPSALRLTVSKDKISINSCHCDLFLV